ncbi:hypothetical protein ACTFIW_013158 [Dictyostelium discoideum]
MCTATGDSSSVPERVAHITRFLHWIGSCWVASSKPPQPFALLRSNGTESPDVASASRIYLRQVYCVTALSTFDGTVLAYHGCNGASLVPAAAVIPAPIAYTKVVAVKKLVVEV